MSTSVLSHVYFQSELQTSCLEIQTASSGTALPSGEYLLRMPVSGALVQVYCEMGLEGGGFTFLSYESLSQLTNEDVQAMASTKDAFLLRLQSRAFRQPYALLKQVDKQHRCVAPL